MMPPSPDYESSYADFLFLNVSWAAWQSLAAF